MYMDISQWKRVRTLVLQDGQSKKIVCKAEHISYQTLEKMLLYEEPPGYLYANAPKEYDPGLFLNMLKKTILENQEVSPDKRLTCRGIFEKLRKQGYQGSLALVYYHQRLHERQNEDCAWEKLQHVIRQLPDDEGTKFLSSIFPKGTLIGSTKMAVKRLKKINLKSKMIIGSHLNREYIARTIWDHWLSEIERTGDYVSRIFNKEETHFLLKKLVTEKNIERKKALVLLVKDQDLPVEYVAKFSGLSLTAIYKYDKSLMNKGVEGSFINFIRDKKEDDEEIKKMVFSLLHEPPSLSGLNRTTWRISDLVKVLKEKGISASCIVLRKIIKNAGYRWRSAKVVLTSNDPSYREKLLHVQNILGSLKENERFFSIDEFGPFSVKMQSGRSLVPPKVIPTVPQFQKSKGSLICTAALELSRNQITHFFSNKKNTEEMIKLVEVLIEKYSYADKLYFSWDAAAWHSSFRLKAFLVLHNETAVSKGFPLLEIVMLPAGAQFLNIIESVFSGMARSVIHNSDYPSKDAAIKAIDLYFAERNQHYFSNPKVAGNKIWGLERTSTKFAPENNCKNPAFR